MYRVMKETELMPILFQLQLFECFFFFLFPFVLYFKSKILGSTSTNLHYDHIKHKRGTYMYNRDNGDFDSYRTTKLFFWLWAHDHL